MRIQLLGINFAPEQTGIAPYTTQLAEHLSKLHDVTVLTGLPHYPDWRVSPDHRQWRREESVEKLRIIRLAHYVPRSPGVVRRAGYELSWAVRVLGAGVRIPTDLVIAVVPALFAAHAGWLLAQKHRVPLGVVVQDVMGNAASQGGVEGGRSVAWAARVAERWALRRATSVATIHPRLATELVRVAGDVDTPKVIYNWTHVSSASTQRDPTMRARLGWRDDEIIALHSGNMGAKQNLEVVVDAARLATREGRPVRFVLAGGGNQRAQLEQYSALCDRIEFIDGVASSAYLDLLAAADALLVNERPGMQDMSLPSKLTSYLVAGRPIVAATDSTSATAEFVRESGGGVITPAGDAGRLLDTVMKVVSDQPLSTRLVESGREFARNRLSPARALAGYDDWVAELTSGDQVAVK